MVNPKQIIEALRMPPNTHFFELMRIELINRIKSEGIAPPDGWQPIETAPIDGCVILLCDRKGNRWTGFADASNWRTDGCGMPPTHWMPLPEPPKGVSDEQ